VPHTQRPSAVHPLLAGHRPTPHGTVKFAPPHTVTTQAPVGSHARPPLHSPQEPSQPSVPHMRLVQSRRISASQRVAQVPDGAHDCVPARQYPTPTSSGLPV
jgi:hypothetical protein